MHEIKDDKRFQGTDMLLPLIFAFVDKATKCTQDGGLTNVNGLYSHLIVEICW